MTPSTQGPEFMSVRGSGQTAKEEGGRWSRTMGWVILSCAAALNVLVATMGVAALASGSIDASRRGASWVVFSVYVAFGVVSLLALNARRRRSNSVGQAVLRNTTLAWAGLLCVFSVLAIVFKWAV